MKTYVQWGTNNVVPPSGGFDLTRIHRDEQAARAFVNEHPDLIIVRRIVGAEPWSAA